MILASKKPCKVKFKLGYNFYFEFVVMSPKVKLEIVI